MSKQDFVRKLTSRKLWLAVALFVSGVLTAAGKGSVAETVSGLIMQAAAVIGYILGEGLVDANNKGTGTLDASNLHNMPEEEVQDE